MAGTKKKAAKAKGSSLNAALAAAARVAFSEMRAARPKERFYFFALYTTEDGGYVAPTAATEEGLEQVVADYRKKPSYAARPIEEVRHDLRFSAPDSPLHLEGEDHFRGLGEDGGPPIVRACIEALPVLDEEGFFGLGAAREAVIVNVVFGDMSHERWLDHARALNPPAAIEGALPYLRIYPPVGEQVGLGGTAYQMNALSLDASRTILAASGSGGEVEVVLWPSGGSLLSLREHGQHWASALTPDGKTLFLGDRTGVHALDVASGRSVVRIPDIPKPGEIRLDPRGVRLAVASWKQRPTIYDAHTGRELRRFDIEGRHLAFSADGALLAIGTALGATVVDVETGAIVAEARLREVAAPRYVSSVAFGPDGVLAVTDEERAKVKLFRGSERIADLGPADAARAAAFSPSGRLLAAAAHREVVVFDLVAGGEVARVRSGCESQIAVAFVDERHVAAVGRDVNDGPAIVVFTISSSLQGPRPEAGNG